MSVKFEPPVRVTVAPGNGSKYEAFAFRYYDKGGAYIVETDDGKRIIANADIVELKTYTFRELLALAPDEITAIKKTLAVHGTPLYPDARNLSRLINDLEGLDADYGF